MAMQIVGRVCPCYRFRDCCSNSAQAKQSGERASLISLSQRFQFHFEARPNVGRVYSYSHKAVIRVYDDAGNVIETHEHAGNFKEP